VITDLINAPFIIAILLALSFHEAAHAFVANALGDPTAKHEGRLTLNPIAHWDPLGTIVFFIVHFGWGKPVPVNPRYFKNIKRDSSLVSLAGPASNLILAVISFFILMAIAPQILHVASADQLIFTHGIGAQIKAFIVQILANSLFINLGLMAFNLLPIAPLDGSKIIQVFVPYHLEPDYEKYLEYGPYILISLLVAEYALNIPILITWISFIVDSVLKLLLLL
jgi:Zn-dependent protease